MPKESRKYIAPKIKIRLQKEIESLCPFCGSKDTDHFEYHHIDENPANSVFENLIMICPTCHSKITSGAISKTEVENRKVKLKNNSDGKRISVLDYSSKESFTSGLKTILSNPESVFYQEIKRNWNYSSLIDGSSFLEELIQKRLDESIEFGLLPTIADFAQKHLNYDQNQKLIYNEVHVYLHDSSEEGYDLPIFSIIQFIGILYATAIINKIDINSVARMEGNMQSIFSSMITSFVRNMAVKEENRNLEYPSNYHWFIGEIFSIIKQWLSSFNEPENFDGFSSYVNFISFNARLCLSELYKGVHNGKITIPFLASRLYYGILDDYFSPDLNLLLKDAIEREVISEIPIQLIEPVFAFALDEAYALRFDQLISGNNRAELRRLRQFLIDHKKI